MNNAVSVSSCVIHLSVSNSCLCLECKLQRTGTYPIGTVLSRVRSCSVSGTPVNCHDIAVQLCNVEDAGGSSHDEYKFILYLESCKMQRLYVVKLYVNIQIERILITNLYKKQSERFIPLAERKAKLTDQDCSQELIPRLQ